jgi:hypothetical protein
MFLVCRVTAAHTQSRIQTAKQYLTMRTGRNGIELKVEGSKGGWMNMGEVYRDYSSALLSSSHAALLRVLANLSCRANKSKPGMGV